MSDSKSHDIRILDVQVDFEPIRFRIPFQFGGRTLEDTELVYVSMIVEDRKGHQARGFGSMPLGNVWAWRSTTIEATASRDAMKRYASKVGELFATFPEFGHPLEIYYAVSAEFHHQAQKVSDAAGVVEPLPELAQLVAASPVDAALHDAYGRIHHKNSFDLLSKQFCNVDLSYFLDDQFQGEYADQYTLRKPTADLPIYHAIGALDPLTDADITAQPNDSFPVTLGQWITAERLTHFKIKFSGNDIDWDIERISQVEKVVSENQKQADVSNWFYSCDFNEQCESAEYVVEFLHRLKETSAAAWDRIQLIEQPTSRDIQAAAAATMHDVVKIKPVVIDEALVDYESLLRCRELGYSGVALKACKGQTESLLAAAAAQKFGMFLCVQDLTCPGASFLHSCSLAAHIPGVTSVEGNGRQYCPSSNERWARLYPELFSITAGTVGTQRLNEAGLGFHLPDWTAPIVTDALND